MTLREVLRDAQALGFLGPGDVEEHLEHTRAFEAAWPAGARRALDLGSGGGVPGLILASRQPEVDWWLVESSERRVAFLEESVARLGVAARVRRGRAEEIGRDLQLRAAFDVVTARSFGPPAVTAECGAPFLHVGGLLLVSDPPRADPRRWPAGGLSLLGLRDDGVTIVGAAHVRQLRLTEPVSDRYPRRVGVPERRPMFPVKRPILDPSLRRRQDERSE